jgi:hypothetical protein
MTFTRINVDPNICQGQPTIRGTRILEPLLPLPQSHHFRS